MTLVVYPDVDIWNYVLCGLSRRSDVQLFPLNQSCNIIQKVLRKSAISSKFPSSWLIGEPLLHALSRLKKNDILLLCEYTELSLISALSKALSVNVSRNLWLWNHKDSSSFFLRLLRDTRALDFRIFSFDESNSRTFKIGWHSQFFCINQVRKTFTSRTEPTFDFFFVGYKKNREDDIIQIQSLLKDFRCCFRVVTSAEDYIPYAKYMEMASHSRCIVEIVHSGDSACTLRPLEALALRCKLLTNNPKIQNYSFYHPSNIFIIGKDNLSALSEFLLTPFAQLTDAVVDSYDVSSWLDSFR